VKPRISRDWIRAEFWRAIRFLSVGALGLTADTAVFTALYAIKWERAVARAVSLGVATCLTWALNRHVTFTRTGRRPAGELGRYALVALVAQGLNYSLFLWLGVVFPRAYPALLILVCSAAAAGFSYLGQRLFAFAPRLAPQNRNAS
jgi:putative flippase GtrA